VTTAEELRFGRDIVSPAPSIVVFVEQGILGQPYGDNRESYKKSDGSYAVVAAVLW